MWSVPRGVRFNSHSVWSVVVACVAPDVASGNTAGNEFEAFGLRLVVLLLLLFAALFADFGWFDSIHVSLIILFVDFDIPEFLFFSPLFAAF